MLCFMQMLAPMITGIIFAGAMSQEFNLKMVIKGFATLGLVIGLDDMFASSFPCNVKKNCKELNESGIMEMPKDHNSMANVCSRYYASFGEDKSI